MACAQKQFARLRAGLLLLAQRVGALAIRLQRRHDSKHRWKRHSEGSDGHSLHAGGEFSWCKIWTLFGSRKWRPVPIIEPHLTTHPKLGRALVATARGGFSP